MKSLFIITLLISSIGFAQNDNTDSPTSVNLRKRTHALNWKAESSVTKIKIDGTTTDSETTEATTNILYLYNMERFEIGGGIASTTSDDGTTKTRTGSLGLIGHFNFIPNNPGNDVIPFLSASVQTLNIDSTVDLSGSAFGIGVGIKYFPLSEIFALTAELGSIVGTISGGSPSIDAKANIGVFEIGWALYF